MCFVATELLFPLPFFKKMNFARVPVIHSSYWLTHVDVDELYQLFLPVRPALRCLYLAWITVYVLIFVFCFWKNHFLVAQPRPLCWRGRGCARLYRFMRFLLVFWELYSNTFQVCIEKHSSHLSHVDLERCISFPPTLRLLSWNSKKRKNCTITYTTFDLYSPSLLFLIPFFSLQVNAFVLLFSLFSEWLFFHVGCSCWKTNRM